MFVIHFVFQVFSFSFRLVLWAFVGVLVVLFYIVMAGFCVAAQEEMQSELTKELLKVEVAGIKQELTIRGEILYVLSDL